MSAVAAIQGPTSAGILVECPASRDCEGGRPVVPALLIKIIEAGTTQRPTSHWGRGVAAFFALIAGGAREVAHRG